MPESVEMLTPHEVATRLGKTERWLERHRGIGDGPPYLKFGKTIRYPADALAQWIAAQTRRSTSEPAAPVRGKRRTTAHTQQSLPAP